MSTQSLIEQTLATVDLALELEPWQIFANAKTHLASNARMTGGDDVRSLVSCCASFKTPSFEGKNR